MTHVAVTGGAGFIGANLVRRLVATEGVGRVTVIDDLSTGDLANLDALPVRFVEGTILDPAALDDAFAGADSVVHLAAIPSVPRSLVDPLRSHEVNATGTLQVLEAARRTGNAHVVLASSSSVYGTYTTLRKHEDLPARPMSPCGVSKLATESYALAYATCFGLDVLPFRLFNVFGPLQRAGHDYAAVVPTFVGAALAGQPLRVFGDGLQTRDFTYVDTATAVITDAVLRRMTSRTPVNLAFGTRTSLRELIAELEDLVGYRLAVDYLPPRTGDIRDSQADNGRLRALFPRMAHVPLRTGLEATVQWFRSQAGVGTRAG